MSKHGSAPRGERSRATNNGRGGNGAGNGDRSATAKGASAGSSGTSGSGRTAASGGTAAPQKVGSGPTAQGSANYRARRASVVRASGNAKGSAQPRLRSDAAQRHTATMPWWKSGNGLIVGALGVVVAFVVIFVIIAHNQTSGSSTGGSGDGDLSSVAVVNAVTGVSPSVTSTVGTGGQTNNLQAAKGASPLTGSDGKPEVLYIGAEYCPYCAAERWSMIVALSRFGTFANLHNMSSSATDVYPSTPTFTFYGSTYSSQYVDFSPVETTTQDPNTPLQTPTTEQQNLLATYDAPPYTSSSNAGAIPFIDIGGRHVVSGAGYNPQVLQGWTREQIAQKLSNPKDAVTQAVVGQANYLTAGICQQTQNKPAEVCSTSAIQAIEQQLPKGS